MALIVILVLRSFRGPGRTAISVDGKVGTLLGYQLSSLPAHLRLLIFPFFSTARHRKRSRQGDLYRRARNGACPALARRPIPDGAGSTPTMSTASLEPTQAQLTPRRPGLTASSAAA